MLKKDTFEYSGVSYHVSIDKKKMEVKFQVNNSKKKQTPDFLNKHYSLSENSVDAFVNHYLFASHPTQLNDTYDSASELIDYSNADLNFYILQLSKKSPFMTEKSVTELFNSGRKDELEKTLRDIFQIGLYMKFGIISMTENSLDMHMWGYYSNKNGFLLKFDTNALPASFKGPFPINYVSEIQSIDYFEYEMGIPILYQSNVKHISWASENEWRYLAYCNSGDFTPFYPKSRNSTRKMYYNPKAVSEVILGYDFISPVEIDYKRRTNEFGFIDFNKQKSKRLKQLKSSILKTIIQNKYPVSLINKHLKKYQLGATPIEIEQISPYKFKIINHSDKVRVEEET
ncbi:MAG TPA: DUF2971 domain-containing protein [Candidatus Cloacimonadota bacterium]|nr:DUF2971 domain-containing protein [Candidatus Cloacimonadota bacterium]